VVAQPDFDHVTQHTKATKIAADIGKFHSELLKQEAEAGRADPALVQHRIKEKGLFSMDGYGWCFSAGLCWVEIHVCPACVQMWL